MTPIAIPALLTSCGFDMLGKRPSIEAIEAVLRRLQEAVKTSGVDAIRENLIRKEAIARLTDAGVSDAAESVAVALGNSCLISFPAAVPLDGPIDGSVLLGETHTTIRRYVVLTEHHAVAVALWVLFTYCVPASAISPILWISSPVKRCGKTQLVIVIGALAYRAILTSNISSSALFRLIDQHCPTLLIDEADTKFGAGGNEELRSILNAGHTRTTAVVIKSAMSADGNYEPRQYSVYGPKVVAGIGRLPGTVEDRAIPISLRRATRSDQRERLRADQIVDNLDWLRSGMAGWSRDNLEALKAAADPRLPESLNDRARDNWRPLIAIADLVGGSWPARARQAAVALTVPDSIDDPGIVALGDLADLFGRQSASTFLSTDDILKALHGRDDRPWSEWGKPGEQANGISAAQLAALLKPFGVRPRSHRDGERVIRGYLRSDCQEAFMRYLSASAA